MLGNIRQVLFCLRLADVYQRNGQYHPDLVLHGKKTAHAVAHGSAHAVYIYLVQSPIAGNPKVDTHQQHGIGSNHQKKARSGIAFSIGAVACRYMFKNCKKQQAQYHPTAKAMQVQHSGIHTVGLKCLNIYWTQRYWFAHLKAVGGGILAMHAYWPLFVNLVSKMPPALHRQLGRCRKYLHNIVVLCLMNFWIFFATALMFAACGNKADAVLQQPPYAALTDSIAKSPANAVWYNRRAALLLENGQDALAEKDFNQSYRLAPDEDNAIGAARFLIGRNSDSAIAFLKEAVKKVPQSLVLQISLARGYQQRKAWDDALEICNRIVAAYPNQLDALVLKSEILKAQNKQEEAIATLEQAYYYAPFDADLVHTLAFDYAEAKNPKALLLADSLLRADSLQRHAEPYYFKGVYYTNTGNKKAALAQFDEAIRHDYAFLDAHMEKGVLQYEMKQYPAAQQTFNRALSVSPAYAYAYYWIGKIAEAEGRRQEAKNNYLRAYNLDKTLTEAKNAADKI